MTEEVKRLPINFGIRFGILNPSIYKQIKLQKLKCNYAKCESFEEIREAINTLNFNSMLTDSQTDKMFLKLYNKILRHVGKENGCDVHPIKKINIP